MKPFDTLRGQTCDLSAADSGPERISTTTRRSFLGFGAMLAGGAATAGMANSVPDPLRGSRTAASDEPTPHQRTYYDKAKF